MTSQSWQKKREVWRDICDWFLCNQSILFSVSSKAFSCWQLRSFYAFSSRETFLFLLAENCTIFLCRFRRLFDGGADVLYVQLWAAVGNFKPTKCYHTFIAQQAAMIYNLRSERQWLEEDNKIQREEKEKSQKNLADLERSAKLKEHN